MAYAGNGEVKMITFSGDLMWTARLSGGGVLTLDMRASCECARLSALLFLWRIDSRSSSSAPSLTTKHCPLAMSHVLRMSRESGPLLLAGSMDGTVVVLDAKEGTVLAKSKPHAKYCIRIAWAPSTLHVVSASWDSSLVVQRWDPGKSDLAATQAGESI